MAKFKDRLKNAKEPKPAEELAKAIVLDAKRKLAKKLKTENKQEG